MNHGELEAYMAGIIDGEGSVDVSRIGNNYQARVVVGQSEQRWKLFDFLMEHFPNGKLYGPFNPKQNRSRMKLLFWTNNHAVHLLERVQRFLVLKANAAETLIKFQTELNKQPRRLSLVCWTTNFRQFAKECHERCRFLNRDGPELQELVVPVTADKHLSLFDD